jgi:CheY-like chemotaxis protein
MPGMDGRAFAAAVKGDKQWQTTPVVGLASDSDGDEPGAFDVLTRKFDREGLMSAIQMHIGGEARAA